MEFKKVTIVYDGSLPEKYEINGIEKEVLYEAKADAEKDQALLAVIRVLKGKDFHDNLLLLLKESSAFGFSTVGETEGDYQVEEEYGPIKGYWINQTVNGGYTGDEYAGDGFVEIEAGRYFKFHYSM